MLVALKTTYAGTRLTISILTTQTKSFHPSPLLLKGIFNTKSAADLWKAATSVSNAGKKKGRGKKGDVRSFIDLNRGRRIGHGPSGKQWPGLTSSPTQGQQVVSHEAFTPMPEKFMEMAEKRIAARKTANFSRRRSKNLPPLQRGFTGGTLRGVLIGPPDPILDYDFPGFQSLAVDLKVIMSMCPLGRKHEVRAGVITGNGKGVVGHASCLANTAATAIRRARNQAGQQLLYVPIRDNRTIWHQAFTQVNNSKVYACPKEPGYGLVCSYLIKSICQLVGIKDIYVKVEGSTNRKYVTEAFLKLLLEQESYQDLAERSGLLVVEENPANAGLPKIVAEPRTRPVRESLFEDEITEVDHLYLPKHRIFRTKPYVPFYHRLPSYVHKMNSQHKYRNQEMLHLERLARADTDPYMIRAAEEEQS